MCSCLFVFPAGDVHATSSSSASSTVSVPSQIGTAIAARARCRILECLLIYPETRQRDRVCIRRWEFAYSDAYIAEIDEDIMMGTRPVSCTLTGAVMEDCFRLYFRHIYVLFFKLFDEESNV